MEDACIFSKLEMLQEGDTNSDVASGLELELIFGLRRIFNDGHKWKLGEEFKEKKRQ